jgi:hypothetical protein
MTKSDIKSGKDEKTILKVVISWFMNKSSMNIFLLERFLNWKFESKTFKRRYWLEIFIILDIFIALLMNCLLTIPISRSLVYWSLLIIIMAFAFYRIIEIICYQFHDILVNTEKTLYDKVRTLFIAFLNYFEIIFWFGFFYHIFYFSFSDENVLNTVGGSLYYSIVTMTTLGSGNIFPTDMIGRVIIIFQVLIALYMALVVIARFIPLLKNNENQ